jgi:predicted helicase
MSQLLIGQYLNQLQDLRKVSGTVRESVVREAFKDLLKGMGRSHDLVFVPEYEIRTPAKERRYVDGALLHQLRVPFGYWEAKDEKDDLDAEIALKFKRGYPKDNIIFDDSREAVLIQDSVEVLRCAVDDTAKLERLLSLFFAYERPEIAEFRAAVAQFKVDLPSVLKALREMIEDQLTKNTRFRKAADKFLAHAKQAINPSLTEADVREMLIQHILTEEIFSKVFDEDDFHRQNNVAKELYDLESVFFTRDVKKSTLKGLEPYYSAIRSAAAQISSHREKQTFLKVIYENFYKVYNAKAADRLGVVYTPNEIVRFMIESADALCEKYFKRSLIDKDVEILDPATGTGTFICELLEHFRGQMPKLRHKYAKELHANEVAILPYYVANLNIEATYAAITGKYVEFPNLCFVDTLDNVGKHTAQKGVTLDLFAGVSEENVERIKRQNKRKISVIIGNPPYNANQLNENDNNKNREYPTIDANIKATYIKESTAQKTKLYDMYARFFRWASNRLAEDGILAFVSNRSFIDSRTFDGFRKVVRDEFNEIYVLDLGGDVRENPKLSGTKHNVFGIQTGVAISFLVKRRGVKTCSIHYARRPEMEVAEDKLAYLGSHRLADIAFEKIKPDAKNNWIGQTDNDFDSLIPLATKAAKAAEKPSDERAVFKQFSFGVVTNRDDWVYGTTKKEVAQRVRYLIAAYNADLKKIGPLKRGTNIDALVSTGFKWTRAVKRDLVKGVKYSFDESRIILAQYRPFVSRYLYFSDQLNEMQNLMPYMFGEAGDEPNTAIVVTDPTSQKPFMTLATDRCPDMHLVGAAAGSAVLPFSRLEDGVLVDNITDWAVDEFKRRYKAKGAQPQKAITRKSIFHYVYAVLHDPGYREKYGPNLKHDMPRIPFRRDFWKWVAWGKELMELHLGFEAVTPFKAKRVDVDDDYEPRPLLKADRDRSWILVDSETTLKGIPAEAWTYEPGGRSAIEWVLEQHKESTSKDSTIQEKFNTYRLADHKEAVIDLVLRVTTVSVKTAAVTAAMRAEKL